MEKGSDNSKSVVIADDHPIIVDAMRMILESAGMRVVGTALDGEEALDLIVSLKPDIAVIDIKMPKKTGNEILNEVIDREIDCKVVFFSAFLDNQILEDAFESGVSGYILKDFSKDEILHAIETVNKGEMYVSPAVYERVKRHGIAQAVNEKLHDRIYTLTETERKVLRLLSQNRTSREIAREMFVSYKTVQNHRTNICKKLDLSGMNALLTFALQNIGLIAGL